MKRKGTKSYTSWLKIRERCRDPKAISYPNYGGKGIDIEDCLFDSFELFFKEVGESPVASREWSIERIDNSLGYVRGNIKWASRKEQSRNKGKYKNNSSGETGINFYKNPKSPNCSTYAVAQWKDINGKPMNKKFSVTKFGLLPAFKAAVEYRRKMIENLNSMGAGYNENHGK